MMRRTPLRSKSAKPKKRDPSKVPAHNRKVNKTRTKAVKEYMGRVAELGCIVCRNLGYPGTPAELHHPRFLAGGGQKAPDTEVIGLCPMHHRLGGYGVAFHAGPKEFEKFHGKEEDLLSQTKKILGVDDDW